MDQQLLSRATDTVMYEMYKGRGGNGDPTFHPAIVQTGYIEDKVTTVRTLSGEEAVSRRRVHLTTLLAVTSDDRFTVNDKVTEVLTYENFKPVSSDTTGITTIYI